MFYKWFSATDISQEIKEAIGDKFKSFTIGGIETGEIENNLPITKRGIMIEVKSSLTTDELNRIDRLLTNFKRKGSKSLSQEFDELKERIDKLEKK